MAQKGKHMTIFGTTLKNTGVSRGLCVLGLMALAFVIGGCQAPAPIPGNSSLNALDASIPSMSGVLRQGDIIQITFATSTNLNTAQRIQVDGNISLQFVNNVPAAGKTPVELAQALEKLYEPHLRGSEPITVTVISNAAAVYVTGAVLRPGRIALERPLTVLDAVMEAGGVDNSRAKLSGVTVLRVENGQRVGRRVNLKRALEGTDTSLFYLKPYDIVYVPEKAINF
jgi:polysaccharide biosynthesis/export protein